MAVEIIDKHAGGINQARDRISKLHLFVANTVPANHGAAGLNHFGKSAGENAFENCEICFFRKAYQRQRSARLATHRVNITQRVGRGDLAKGVRIVHHRSEEVHSLHQRSAGAEQIHSGVVGLIKANQNIRVMLPG